MRFVRTLTATCIVALIAGCATPQDRGRTASTDKAREAEGEAVVTAQRRNEQVRDQPAGVDQSGCSIASAPPPPPPPPMPSQVLGRAAPSGALKSEARRMNRFGGGFVPPVIVPSDPGSERYDGKEVSPVHVARNEPVSTFSVDVDTGAYANARRFLTAGQLPPKDAVRSEELINYFPLRLCTPGKPGDTVFGHHRCRGDAVECRDPAAAHRPQGLRPAAFGPSAGQSGVPRRCFRFDDQPDKLPLVKTALAGLAGELSARDKVSIVVYAGAAGLVLEPTNDERKIRAALDRLSAGGSTAGGAGLQLAYQIARDNFIEGGVNRVMLATDGDFNVGVSDTKSLIAMVERERDSGITLTTLGFGTGNLNDAMMEQVADHGNGNYAYIDSALEARKVLGEQMTSTLFTIAKDVKIQVEFNPAQVSQYRLLGYENRALREEDFDNDKVDAGDIGAGHQVTAIYEIVPAGSSGWSGPRRYDTPRTYDDQPPSVTTRGNEMAFVKLRYKLPDGQTSRLIERPVLASAMHRAVRPTGDFAFATAVAAFGQTLRGDNLMKGYSHAQIVALAGRQSDFWRQEFVKLVGLAGSLAGNDTGVEREREGG